MNNPNQPDERGLTRGQPEDREFMNIDLKEDREPLTPEQEKWAKALRDVERVRRIRRKAAEELGSQEAEIPGDPGQVQDTGGSPRETAPDEDRKGTSGTGSRKAAGGTARKNGSSKGSGAGSGGRRGKRSARRKGNKVPLILLACLLLAGIIGVRSIGKRTNSAIQDLPVGQKAEEEIKLPEHGFYTVAVFGVDSRDGSLDKGALSDVNMIAALNWETGEAKIVSVYRDTLVRINDKGQLHKFNEAYFKGGSEQALWAIRNNLDIVPDEYITFNWKAVIDAINILGGVDIEITEPEFFYINAFITETVNATGIGSVQLKKAGMNHLDGVQAVAYARLRLMDTDFQRTERQRKVVKLLMEKLKKASLATRIQLVTCVLPETKTSVTVGDILPIVRQLDVRKFHLGETCGFPYELKTTYVNKMDVVVPVTLESNVRQLHEFLYGAKDYKPGKSVQDINYAIVKKTGLE